MGKETFGWKTLFKKKIVGERRDTRIEILESPRGLFKRVFRGGKMVRLKRITSKDNLTDE